MFSSEKVSKRRELTEPGTHLLYFMEERGPNRLRLFEVKESAQGQRACWIKDMMELDGKLTFLVQGSQRVTFLDHLLR